MSEEEKKLEVSPRNPSRPYCFFCAAKEEEQDARHTDVAYESTERTIQRMLAWYEKTVVEQDSPRARRLRRRGRAKKKRRATKTHVHAQ